MNPKVIEIIKRFSQDPVVKHTAEALLLSIIKEKFGNNSPSECESINVPTTTQNN